jgi:twinkle protein
MSNIEFLKDLKINPNGGEQQYMTCPNCSHSRKKKTDPCLSVNLKEGIYKCHHCGVQGTLRVSRQFQKKAEESTSNPIEFNNATKLPKQAVQWFTGRGITQNTIKRNDIFYKEAQWFRTDEGTKELPAIGFPCKDGDETFFIQYRSKEKNFSSEKGGTPLFFGLNDIRFTSEAIIVEGYIDKMSFDEVGMTNCVSVPNGATISQEERKMFEQTGTFDKSKPLELKYLDRNADIFDSKEKIYLATDNDAPGLKLREELARRLGRERCYLVKFPPDCKDANDVLCKYGSEQLKACVELAQPFPLEGVLTVKDLNNAVDHIHEYGLPRGVGLGYKKFDELLTFRAPEFTLITGVPGHGKTYWAMQMAVHLAEKHKWKFGIFSAENQPYELVIADLVSMYIGKAFFKKDVGVTKEELEHAKTFISKHFFFIEIQGQVLKLDDVLDKGRQLVRKHGINALIIDTYSALDSTYQANMREDQFLKQQLNKLRVFRYTNDISVWMVAHPKTMPYDQKGKLRRVGMYDISGGSQWYNAIDNGIVVHRNMGDNSVDIIVEKVKFWFMGQRGEQRFQFDINSKRYLEDGIAEEMERRFESRFAQPPVDETDMEDEPVFEDDFS